MFVFTAVSTAVNSWYHIFKRKHDAVAVIGRALIIGEQKMFVLISRCMRDGASCAFRFRDRCGDTFSVRFVWNSSSGIVQVFNLRRDATSKVCFRCAASISAFRVAEGHASFGAT